MAQYQGASRRLTNQSMVGIPTQSPLLEDLLLAQELVPELVPVPHSQ